MGLYSNNRWIYLSTLSIKECKKVLLSEPQTFGDNPCFPEHYECNIYSDTCLQITFKGGKIKRTEYLVSFFPETNFTKIVLDFQHELFGFPPMTSVYVIDKFMKEKIQAYRV